jgi:hypothetical protein
MSMTDPIADLLVRIKNAAAVGKQTVKAPSSKIKVAIAEVLKAEGYITDLRVTKIENNKAELEIVLKYFEGKPVIETLTIQARSPIHNIRTHHLTNTTNTTSQKKKFVEIKTSYQQKFDKILFQQRQSNLH